MYGLYYFDKQTYKVLDILGLTGTSSAFINMAHYVKYQVVIQNFTNQQLQLVDYEVHSGHIQSAPKNTIMAGHKESFNYYKMSCVPTGASCSLTYRMGTTNNIVAIFIYCPYSFTWSGGNTLALKFYQMNAAQMMSRNYIFDQMRMTEGPWKKSFRSGGPPLHVTMTAGEYSMQGTMGTDHTTEVEVLLYPKDSNRLATRLMPSLGHQLSSGVAGVVKAVVKVLEDMQEYSGSRCNVA